MVDDVEQPMENIDFGPIQKVFKQNLKQGLLTFQQYLDEQKKQRNQLRQSLQQQANFKKSECADDQKLVEIIQQNLERQLQDIDSKY